MNNNKSSFIQFTKVLLFLGFCYALINSFLNLMCEETGITNSKEKVNNNKKLPIPGFTIRPFDPSPKANYYFPNTELQSRMKNGKEFPKWFKPMNALKKLTNESHLKSEFGLSWHQVWAIEAKCKSKAEKISCLQLVSFNPPKSFVPNDRTHLQFEITLQNFTMYAIYFHEPMESNWWTTNIDEVEIFHLNYARKRYTFCLKIIVFIVYYEINFFHF